MKPPKLDTVLAALTLLCSAVTAGATLYVAYFVYRLVEALHQFAEHLSQVTQ